MSGGSSRTRSNKGSSTSTNPRGRKARTTAPRRNAALANGGDISNQENIAPQAQPSDSTTSLTLAPSNTAHTPDSALAEIERLKAELEAARAAAEQAQALAAQAQAQAHAQSQSPEIVPIPRPRGDVGKDWKLRDAMGLENNMGLYRNIARTVPLHANVRYAAVEARINLDSPFKAIPVEKLANVYKQARDTHPYLDRRRFPADWPTVELLKQFLKNHCKYDRKKSLIPPDSRTSPSSRRGSVSLPNIDQ